MLQGHGNNNPLGMFLADGGAQSDLESNYVLSGNTKKTLQQFCNEARINYGDFYNTALIKEKIISHEGNEGVWTINARQITPLYEDVLVKEIEAFDPKCIVPLGELGFRWLTGHRGIRKFRGSVLPTTNPLLAGKVRKVLPILGPTPFLNKEYKLRAVTRIDFQKLKRQLNDSPIPENQYNTWICNNAEALRNYLHRSIANNPPFLVFDWETIHGVPSCISFCMDGRESVCIPFMDSEIDIDNRTSMIKLIADTLASDIPKINQNIKYDWKIGERFKFKVNNVVGDTGVALNCIYPEFPKNLGFITSIYTDIPYFKDEGREFDPSKHNKKQFYLYNAKDSLAVAQTYPEQLEEMRHFGVDGVYRNLVKLMPIYIKMENRGILIDEERKLSLIAKYESLHNVELLKLRKMVGREINPNSPKQCQTLIFEDLGYSKIPGVTGTDEESLEMLLAYGEPKRAPITGPDILISILNCRKIRLVRGILEDPIYPDGRFRGEYNLSGTKNGRTSSSGSIDKYLYFDEKGKILSTELGHSLQTIGKHGFQIDGVDYGKDIRTMFVADKGYTFVGLDRSQAEARVDTILAGNFDMLSVFDGPIGIHRLTGSWVYKCDPSEIKKNVLVDGYDRYHISKTVRHAGERNMKAHRLAVMTRLPRKEAEQVLETFHNNQPEIRGVFHRDVKRVVAETRRLVAPNGRHRLFFDRLDDHMYNEAISTLPQMIVSDDTKFPLIEMAETMPWALPIQEAHDGILFMIPKGRELELAEKGAEAMEREGIDFRKCSLPRDYRLVIPTEAECGDSWGYMEDLKFR